MRKPGSTSGRSAWSSEQAEKLWSFLEENTSLPSAEGDAPAAEKPQFRAAHLLYYFGGLLAIGAASLFLNAAWGQLGPWIGRRWLLCARRWRYRIEHG